MFTYFVCWRIFTVRRMRFRMISVFIIRATYADDRGRALRKASVCARIVTQKNKAALLDGHHAFSLEGAILLSLSMHQLAALSSPRMAFHRVRGITLRSSTQNAFARLPNSP